jgi:transcription-repair coupling factor (superfamily II helicase)
MIKLEKNTSYINNWNYFSKSLILKENKDLLKYVLFIVSSGKDLNNYEKLFEFLNIDFQTINSQENLIDYLFNKKWFYIINSEILENQIDKKNQLLYNSLNLKVWETINYEELIKKLNSLNFKFSEYENPSSFNKKWDILTINSSDFKKQYIISFWWDTIENITQIKKIWEIRKDKTNLDNVYIGKADKIQENIKNNNNILDNILDNNCLVILDNLDFDTNYDNIIKKSKDIISFDYLWNKKLIIKDLEIKSPKIENSLQLKEFLEKNKNTIIYTKNPKTINNFIEYNNLTNIEVKESKLNNIKSFQFNNIAYVCDDILNTVFTKKRIKNSISSDLDLLLKIKPWDYVVHIDHWIGIFKEIIKKELPIANKKGTGTLKKEFLEIEYLNNDKLFVPITEVWRVNKYVWAEEPKLTPLGWTTWEKKLQKAKQEAEEIAEELIELYAQRKLQKAFSFKAFPEKEEKFKNSFSYIHTPDQTQAIGEILNDMEKETPMDRLLIGDVWFWKTEIAFNTIYRAFLNKKQSILIAPLIVLAYEHFEKALERFKNFWLKIEVLTRLETPKKEAEILKKLACWEIDLIIWTHKLLSDKINFKDLWLIIIDEEHKFWVADKEKIKQFKNNIDSLAMSATPIPRSLNMALSKLREISILKTPPFGRQDVSTIINKFDENIIKQALEEEFKRWWQVFFVHNRVWNIENYKTILQKLVPDKKIVVAHWQMSALELEKRILAFKHKKYDILLSTTVIENWIDFPNVNTIIINQAPSFWLSQIHQLRWRVGRSDKKWYCYLLYKNEKLKDETIKRLKTIVQYSYVWAWFELALKDLEIRWWWDLLGFRQSGQSSQIGVNLFLKLVEEKIEEIKGTGTQKTETKIDLNLDLDIDESFFDWELDKINFYREIENISDLETLKSIKDDFVEKHQKLDKWLENLFKILKLKIKASEYKIISIKKVGINYQLDFEKNIKLEELKWFLELDKEVKFTVVNINKLRTSTKNFENEQKFLEYLHNLFFKKINKKIKLKRKI